MNAEHLLDAIGLLDDELIREAESYRRPKRNYKPWIGLAACLAVMLTLHYGLTHIGMGGGSAAPGNSASGGSAPAASVPAGGETLPSEGDYTDASDVPALPEPGSANGGEDHNPPKEDICPAIMVDGVLYFFTGEPIPGEPDPGAIRTVASYTSGVPEMDNQTNFSQDLSAQYAVVEMGGEQKLAVLMEQEWILFDTVPPEA